jgi:hypothetical protein
MVVVVSIGAIGALVIWHLVRRGRLIRESLGPPRGVELPELNTDSCQADESTSGRKGAP